MANVTETFERRGHPQPWQRIVPPVILPVRGLMTGHEYITRFIDTTRTPPCKTTQPPR